MESKVTDSPSHLECCKDPSSLGRGVWACLLKWRCSGVSCSVETKSCGIEPSWAGQSDQSCSWGGWSSVEPPLSEDRWPWSHKGDYSMADVRRTYKSYVEIIPDSQSLKQHFSQSLLISRVVGCSLSLSAVRSNAKHLTLRLSVKSRPSWSPSGHPATLPPGRSSCRLQTSCSAPWSGGSRAGRRTSPCPSPSAARSLCPCGGTPLCRRPEMPRDSRCRAPWTAALLSGGRASPRSGNAKRDRPDSGFPVFTPGPLCWRSTCHGRRKWVRTERVVPERRA